ncbi:MAG: V-type ATPase subunit [Candidatus Omnitrophica bacterium]|nr:V-type ATPase subunit [Candidatus Omnitrophota bacterium]
MKKPGIDARYTYAVARIRALETRLLTDSAFENILEEDSSGALRVLAEFKGYPGMDELLRQGKTPEEALSSSLLETYNLIRGMAEEEELIDPFFRKLDLFASSPGASEGGEGTDTIWNIFRKAWQGNLFLNEYLRIAADLENAKIFLRAKIQLRDKKFLAGCLVEGGYVKPAEFLELFGESMDTVSRRLGGPRYNDVLSAGITAYRSGGKLAVLERDCDNFLMGYIKKAKYFHFGIEPLVSYALAKENEVKNLRVIFIGMENNFKPEETRAYLRNSYV